MLFRNSGQHRRRLALIVCLACMFTSASLYSATPSVLAGGVPFGGSYDSVSEESPTFPLAVTYSNTVGPNSVFAGAVPGQLLASSEIANGVNPFDQSLAVTRFVDHFHLTNVAKPDNSTGTFIYTLLLTGTMKIKEDSQGVAAVSVNLNRIVGDNLVGYLEVSQQGSIARLYGIGGEGGGAYPLNNIFAEPDGSIIVYSTTSAIGGFFTFNVRIAVNFRLTNFPYNQVPSAADAFNLVEFELSAISFKNALSDFSTTFEFAQQNPIVPDPFDPSLPIAGWDISSSSGEIALPAPTFVATATGTGDAAFGAEFGTIENLIALDDTSFPDYSSINAEFPHGFFDFEIIGLETGEVTNVDITLPGPMAGDSVWWYYDSTAGWSTLPTIVVAGTGFVEVAAIDGMPGDFSEVDGEIRLVGGPSVVETIFTDGFEDVLVVVN